MLARLNSMARRFGAIALAALFMRAILPDGWMLAEAQGPEGRYLTVELCEGHGEKPKVIDLDTGLEVDPSVLPHDGDDNDEAPPCVFAAASPMAPPAALAQPVVFVVVQDVAFNVVRVLRPGRGIPAPPPPSTGPPSLI